ncbi:MAG: MobC family plasmid mobilization relaxosome protein [Oscillospiraceae bacterium]|nr:MobC family plasmid mobilization relaxosome protein [Oscillospiraceae bacterium]
MQKQQASKLGNTDFFVSLLKGSTIKVYNFNETANELYRELRKIGVNLNQIAMLANSGRLPEAERGIWNMLNAYYGVMESLKLSLDKPLINAEILEIRGDVP